MTRDIISDSVAALPKKQLHAYQTRKPCGEMFGGNSIGVGQYEQCLSVFWHESDWSRRKILLFFLLFLNNGMNNGRLCHAQKKIIFFQKIIF